MTKLRPFLVGLTAASLIALPGAATASSPSTSAAAAAPKAPFKTTVRFLDSDHTRAFGTKTVVRGQVVSNHGAGAGSIKDVRVQLLRKLGGNSTWKSLGYDNTGRSDFPKFRFSVKTVANASYRVVFKGNATHKKSRNTTQVSAYRLFGAKLKDGSGRFHGKLSPRYAHQRIYLEKRRCATCNYVQIKSERTSGASKYSFKVGAPRHGQWWWRLSVPASSKFIESYSAIFSTRRK